MRSSFRQDDVTLLLKDITGLVDPLPTAEREKRIQGGTHYSEMLPLEYRPSEAYLALYEKSMELFGGATAEAVSAVSGKIARKKGPGVVIVSLARAGTPPGILIRRYIRAKYGYECPHYSISIIRDRGIDRNAVRYILERHRAEDVQFVDGWTGKGIIYRELRREIAALAEETGGGLSDELAVVADPAGLTDLCGTREDVIIPSSCLNCTVCGLISRTFLRADVIGKGDFHGAAYYGELAAEDRTYEFIDAMEKRFNFHPEEVRDGLPERQGPEIARQIAERWGVRNINYVKPGIGETIRVLLRRVPWRVLIDERYRESPELEPVRQLAREKGTDVEYTQLERYKCCGIIRQLADI